MRKLLYTFWQFVCSGGPYVAINIPACQWHTVRALESVTFFLECKDGPYEPLGRR